MPITAVNTRTTAKTVVPLRRDCSTPCSGIVRSRRSPGVRALSIRISTPPAAASNAGQGISDQRSSQAARKPSASPIPAPSAKPRAAQGHDHFSDSTVSMRRTASRARSRKRPVSTGKAAARSPIDTSAAAIVQRSLSSSRNTPGSTAANSSAKTSVRIRLPSRARSSTASHVGCISSRKNVGLPSRTTCLASQLSQAMVSLGAKRMSLLR